MKIYPKQPNGGNRNERAIDLWDRLSSEPVVEFDIPGSILVIINSPLLQTVATLSQVTALES